MIENMKRSLIPPCPKCPWKLGRVCVDPNPCPMCRLDNYSTYDTLIERVGGMRGYT